MDIPPFHEVFLPFLSQLAHEGPFHTRDVQERLQASSGLAQEQLAERIPSGTSTVVENRIG